MVLRFYILLPTESCLPLQCAIDEICNWIKIRELEIAPTMICELVIKSLFIHISLMILNPLYKPHPMI